jgi:hypothetical protein
VSSRTIRNTRIETRSTHKKPNPRARNFMTTPTKDRSSPGERIPGMRAEYTPDCHGEYQ